MHVQTSLLFAPLAVRVYTSCSVFPFYTPTKPLIQLHIKYKTVWFPKVLIISLINVNISNKLNFWSVDGFLNTLGIWQSKVKPQETRSVHDSMTRPKSNSFLK